MFLFRRLPLKVGYKVDVPICAPIGTGPMQIGLEVLDREKVKVPAGEFDCYKVHLPLVQQTFWYGTDEHRYLVKFEAGGIVVELDSIRTNEPGALVEYQDDQFGFTVAAPTEWYFVKHERPDSESKQVLYMLLDPEAATISALRAKPLSELSEEKKASPRAWADADVKSAQEAYKNYTVRPQSWKQFELSGQPAVSFVADYVKGQRSMVEFCVYSQGNGNAISFSSKLETEWFEKLDEQLASIIRTFKAN